VVLFRTGARPSLTSGVLAARTLYEKVLPDAVKQFSPLTAYHPGSPWGGKTTRDQTEGDIHQWDVWHGSQQPYQQWNRLGGRFVSEFGMQGLPSIHTIDYLLDGNDEDRYPQSETIEHHNKADSWERRLGLYTMENIKVPSLDMQDWVYATQLLQAECLGQAYSVWRRDWKGPGREYAAGALVWQINDCWACTSWAISDFFKRPKLAYYAIKRESASKVLGIYRKAESYDLWICNATLEDLSGKLEWSTFDIATGRQLSSESKDIQVKPNQATDILNEVSLGSRSRSTVVFARLVDANGQLICRAVNWPEPLKHLHFPSRRVSVRVDVQAGTVSLSSNKPIKGVELYVAADGLDRVFFHDVRTDLPSNAAPTDSVYVPERHRSCTWRDSDRRCLGSESLGRSFPSLLLRSRSQEIAEWEVEF
jgi:beta-mannosidase